MVKMRALTSACLLLALGCSGGRDHAAELATAKCGHALHEALHLSESDTNPALSAIHVVGLGQNRRRVDGMFSNGGAPARPFVCEVTPDAADKLRGLRVTRLQLDAS